MTLDSGRTSVTKLTVCVLHVCPQLLLLLAVSEGAGGVAAFLFVQDVVTYLPREEATELNICHVLQDVNSSSFRHHCSPFTEKLFLGKL